MKKLLLAIPLITISSFAAASYVTVENPKTSLALKDDRFDHSKDENQDRIYNYESTKFNESFSSDALVNGRYNSFEVNYANGQINGNQAKTSELNFKTSANIVTWNIMDGSKIATIKSSVNFSTGDKNTSVKLTAKANSKNVFKNEATLKEYLNIQSGNQALKPLMYTITLSKIDNQNTANPIYSTIFSTNITDTTNNGTVSFESSSALLSIYRDLEKNTDYKLDIITNADTFGGYVNYDLLDWKTETNLQFSTTSEVPVPAAAWLLGSALAGLAFKRRK